MVRDWTWPGELLDLFEDGFLDALMKGGDILKTTCNGGKLLVAVDGVGLCNQLLPDRVGVDWVHTGQIVL